jgi:hypothetical protein
VPDQERIGERRAKPLCVKRVLAAKSGRAGSALVTGVCFGRTVAFGFGSD